MLSRDLLVRRASKGEGARPASRVFMVASPGKKSTNTGELVLHYVV